MVRRIGFGDGNDGDPREARPARRPATRLEAETETPAAKPSDQSDPAKRPSGWVRFVIVLFLLVWLAVWSFGIWFAFQSISEAWERGAADGFDWFALGFLAIWLFFALVGWAFGIVFLVVTLFGKPVTPERRAEKQARRAARHAERAARRQGHSR